MPTIIPITDFAAPELDIYARLTENQLLNRADPANALFVAESPLVIGRALDAGCTPVSFLMETKHVNGKGAEILARCPADIPVYAAELKVLTQLTGFHLTRGMLCAMRRPPLPAIPCTAGPAGSAWAMCFWYPGPICRRVWIGRRLCGNTASRLLLWPCGRTPSV